MHTTTLAKTPQQVAKEATCNSIILAQLLLTSLRDLPGQEVLAEHLLSFQRKQTVTLPQQTQQWVMREIGKDKLEVLPHVIKQHIEVLPGLPAYLYKELSLLLDFMHTFNSKMKKVDSEKYRLLMEFIRRELAAEVTRGTTCLSHSDGNLTFSFARPVNGEEVEDEL